MDLLQPYVILSVRTKVLVNIEYKPRLGDASVPIMHTMTLE